MEKQGKRSKKKNLSKEAFRKIRYKQNMWRVYKHTLTDKDYDAYKEALHAATNEVSSQLSIFLYSYRAYGGGGGTMPAYYF